MDTINSANCKPWDLPPVEDKPINFNNTTILPKDLAKQKQESERKLNIHKEQAYEEGFIEGKKAGEEFGLEKFRLQTENVETIYAILDNLIKEYDSKLEEQVIDLVKTMVGSVIRYEITINNNVIINLVKEALASLPKDAKEIKIHINQDDLQLIQQAINKKEITGLGEINFISDPNILRGGCIINSNWATIDASLTTRLNTILNKL